MLNAGAPGLIALPLPSMQPIWNEFLHPLIAVTFQRYFVQGVAATGVKG